MSDHTPERDMKRETRCPKCDSIEWFPGAACFGCGWEGSAQDAYLYVRSRLGDSAKAEAAKDAAYSERNKLVAALSRIWPSSLERHPDSDADWEDDWRWIVFVDGPAGQMTWHIHDSELPLFAHLERCSGRVWDGHTTEEKYERLGRVRR